MRPLSLLSLHFLTNPRPPRPTPFPYTTLFRSPVPRRPWSRHVPRKPRRAPGRTANSCTARGPSPGRSEEHTSELQSRGHLVCRLLLEKKKKAITVIVRLMPSHDYVAAITYKSR